MVINKRLFTTLAPICILTIVIAAFSAGVSSAAVSDVSIKNLDAGFTWIINETTSLTGLTIADGSAIKAPEGFSVTMTVDGVETGIKPGIYKGRIVLTVTRNITIDYLDHGATRTFQLRTAIDIENGKYAADKSVAAAVAGGKVTDISAKDVKITSKGDNFSGIIVRSDSKSSYSIINPVIKLTGNGGSDFVGDGAGIMTDGKADVIVNNASIINKGVIRAAVVVRGNSTIHVNDSNIEVSNGILPEKIVGMMQVPWVLGLVGNVRATNAIDNATAYYNNTHIKAQAWGAISTDATKVIRLYATKCIIETVESGYGAYSIGDTIAGFSGCIFNVADYGMIMASKGDGVFTNDTVVNSGRFGVMMHSGSGGTLTIDKGSVFNTKSTVIQVKGRGADIIIDNAKMNSESGIILQAMVNDDPNTVGGRDRGMFPAAPTGSGVAPSGAPAGGSSSVAGTSGSSSAITTGIPGVPLSGSSDVTATFKNMTLNGDIINSMTTLGDMIVTFKNATITGAITTGAAELVNKTPAKETYKLIGEVKNTYCATDDKYGMKLFLDKDSKWIVDKTSYLNVLSIAESASIAAPKGYTLTMTVDGSATPISAGSYTGKIVLTIK